MNILIKKLTEEAITPSKKFGDCGWDLYSLESYILKPFERYLFKTGISISLPKNYYGRVCDRSGKAYKDGLHVLAGQVDNTYRGDVSVVLINLNKDIDVEILKGDRIAQMVIEPYLEVDLIETDDLNPTIRGIAGWGASGR